MSEKADNSLITLIQKQINAVCQRSRTKGREDEYKPSEAPNETKEKASCTYSSERFQNNNNCETFAFTDITISVYANWN